MKGSFQQHLADEISSATGQEFVCHATSAAGGGCINQAMVISDGETSFFVKLNRAALADMFSAEAAGLREITGTASVRVPAPICHGHHAEYAYLVLEHVPMRGLDAPSATALGEQLARMHRHTSGHFGWDRDNTIGSTPQHNDNSDDWVRFWRHQRLEALTDKLKNQAPKQTLDVFYALTEKVDVFFRDYTPVASLLHGDLWGGNVSRDEHGAPVIFDPAVYYGDRETDIAMTELFGRLGENFYAAYHEQWPLDDGYALRRDLYNLYHVLNHALLFGGGYLSQARGMAGRLLAATG